jgi:hypothetical protein
MIIYRVHVGYNADYYGHPTTEKAEYYMDKAKAEKRYKEGEFTVKETHTTTRYADGTTHISTTGGAFYKRQLEEAKRDPNIIKVELVDKVYNHFRLDEIQVTE